MDHFDIDNGNLYQAKAKANINCHFIALFYIDKSTFNQISDFNSETDSEIKMLWSDITNTGSY